MIRGEVADRFATPFVAALKQLVEGIIKAVRPSPTRSR